MTDAQGAETNSVKCVRCQGDAPLLGKLPIVTGSHSGAAKFWMGQWAEMDEHPWVVQVYRCSTCSHVELFDLDRTMG